jgi:[FeFe] hydrogenase H-cluster maturation GTPase HydF
MSNQRANRGFRLHVGLVGRRNVGKSSLINAFMGQDVAIVSPEPGTTTDPVSKPMELQPIGPVLLIDTAGLDDQGTLGGLRMERTRRMLDRCDVFLLVVGAEGWGPAEVVLLEDLRARKLPIIIVCSQSDKTDAPSNQKTLLADLNLPVLHTSAVTGAGLDELRREVIKAAPDRIAAPPALVHDLVGPGGLAVLVIPIDKEAPRGRLIMPQVQAVRDLLDGQCQCLVVQTDGLAAALANFRQPPQLVVTDSQAFTEVSEIVPPDIPLTSFSILMARHRGDLPAQVQGARAIAALQPGDQVLVAEGCSHHPVEEDIGRVKIPRWLQEHVGGKLQFTTVTGHDFPADLTPYKLVVQCGACTMNRQEVLGRVRACQTQAVPVSNYGIVIAYSLGIFERALAPFGLSL